MSSQSTWSQDNVLQEVVSNLLLFAIVFSMAGSVHSRPFNRQIINSGAWLTGLFLQFVVLPGLGFLLTSSLKLDFYSGVTLIILTTSPGGVYSNWCSSLFNGDLALSISMTLISTFVGLVMLPCNVVVYVSHVYNDDAMEYVNFGKLFLSLTIVLVAVITGLYCSFKVDSTRFNLFLNRIGNVFALTHILLALIIVGIDDGLSYDIWEHSWGFYICLALPCITGLLLATLLTTWFHLERPERITAAMECSCQNINIAISVAIGMFDSSEVSKALVVPLYIGLVNVIVLGLYFLIVWKMEWTKAPSDKNIFVVLFKSYNIWESDAEQKNLNNEDRNHIGGIIVGNQLAINETFQDGGSECDDGTTSIEMATSQENVSSPLNLIKVNTDKAPLSPTSTIMPGTSNFEEAEICRSNSFKKGKPTRRHSNAARTMVIDETICEDSIAEDPELSVGESDLESGLSMSHHSQITLNRPLSSREGGAPGNVLPSIPSQSSFRNSSNGDNFPTVDYNAYVNSEPIDDLSVDDITETLGHKNVESDSNVVVSDHIINEPFVDKKAIEDNAACNETVSVSVGSEGDDNEESSSNEGKVMSEEKDEEGC